MADNRTNLSPANALVGFGLLGLGLMVGWVLALGFGIAAVVTGIREGYSDRVMAMAVFSVTFASSTLWDHYLGVLVPVILRAWPAAGTRRNTVWSWWYRRLSAAWRSRPFRSESPANGRGWRTESDPYPAASIDP